MNKEELEVIRELRDEFEILGELGEEIFMNMVDLLLFDPLADSDKEEVVENEG